MSAAGADAHSVFGPDQGQPTRTVQHDYSQAGIGAFDTDEVDPVAEADVYMAYGRDAQAEEILKEALQKDVTRHAARVKLLEIYAARKDLKAFETTAGELFAATQGHGPQWEQAAALGAKLDPDNPLYAAVAEPAGALPPDYQGLKLHAEQHMAGQALDPIPLEAERISADAGLGYATAGLGLDLGEGILQGEPTVDLELTELRLDAEHPAPGRGAAAPGQDRAPLDFGSISLDLGPGPGSTSGAVPGAEPAAEAGVAGPTDARWQEAATKLDLAKAYREMGDRDGARELLAEVVKEGDVVQQEQARKLLEAID
jgi:pilus assembly protein FimV